MTWSGGLNEFSMPKPRYIIERMALFLAIEKLGISEGLEIEEISQVLNTLPKKNYCKRSSQLQNVKGIPLAYGVFC